MFTLEETLWLFLIYAFLGWCTEVAFAAVTRGKFVNRGMANGPICPIYGFGVLAVLFCLQPFRGNFFLLFLGSVVVTSLLELVTGWALEKFFHDKWWDYSNEPFNIKGYICLRFSILWGLACLLVVNIVQPSIFFVVQKLENLPGRIALGVCLAAFVTDEIITFVQLLKLPRQLRAIEETQKKLRVVSDGIGSSIADHVLSAVEKEQAFRESPRGQELLLKQAQFKEKAKDLAALLQSDRDEDNALRQAELQMQSEKLRQQWEEEKADFIRRTEEAESLRGKMSQLLSQNVRTHRRLLSAFPALGEGSHKEALSRIREKWEARKK